MVPQLQEKASVINDGQDITWDIGNGNAGASRYTSMIEAVRQRASQGQFLRDRTHRKRPGATSDYSASTWLCRTRDRAPRTRSGCRSAPAICSSSAGST